MIKIEFGIIDEIEPQKDYSKYEPEKYHCVCIDNDAYIDVWWDQLQKMPSFSICLSKPGVALDRWGVTIIPPESLWILKDIVCNDSRIKTDSHLVDLVNVILRAIEENKYMIHFGV